MNRTLLTVRFSILTSNPKVDALRVFETTEIYLLAILNFGDEGKMLQRREHFDDDEPD